MKNLKTTFTLFILLTSFVSYGQIAKSDLVGVWKFERMKKDGKIALNLKDEKSSWDYYVDQYKKDKGNNELLSKTEDENLREIFDNLMANLKKDRTIYNTDNSFSIISGTDTTSGNYTIKAFDNQIMLHQGGPNEATAMETLDVLVLTENHMEILIETKDGSQSIYVMVKE